VTIPETPPPRTGLTVAFVPGVTLTKWRRIWAERLPRVPLDVVEVAEDAQRAALDDRVVDMCFARLPIDTAGVHAIRLYEEVPVVVLPKDHALAELDELALADLDGETVVVGDADASAVERVAWGSGVARVPHSIARSESRKDVVYRPLTDAEPTTIALTWLADNDNPLIEEFIGIVRGRTANSSRTAAARAAKQPSTPKTPPKTRAPKPKPKGRGRRR